METQQSKEAYLSFRLGNELFAVSVHKVLEVLQKQVVTEVPETPDFIAGVINFRGEIVPVAETHIKFHMPTRSQEEKSVIVVLELQSGTDNLLISMTADAVKDVFEISDSEIKPVPPMGNSISSEFISGMVQKNGKFIMLLNIDKVFSTEEVGQLASSTLV
ncbi:MAG: chemotaxis protein CheW [Bacteroidota bacterium]|jgi:Chemotaxis signal transduction protein|nr:chemotaxis protein CheW [Bacteroidota bacterium]